jgi:hypothetical protein
LQINLSTRYQQDRRVGSKLNVVTPEAGMSGWERDKSTRTLLVATGSI